MVFGVETGKEVGGTGQIKIGFVEEQCFKLGVKEIVNATYRVSRWLSKNTEHWQFHCRWHKILSY